jgi:hypothetical protein
LTWLAGAVGLAALLRHLSRRQAPATVPPAAPPVGEDPADELRRKLADQHAGVEVEADAEPVPTDEEDAAGLEERRARVHAQAQAAIDSMRDAGADDPESGSNA